TAVRPEQLGLPYLSSAHENAATVDADSPPCRQDVAAGATCSVFGVETVHEVRLGSNSALGRYPRHFSLAAGSGIRLSRDVSVVPKCMARPCVARRSSKTDERESCNNVLDL